MTLDVTDDVTLDSVTLDVTLDSDPIGYQKTLGSRVLNPESLAPGSLVLNPECWALFPEKSEEKTTAVFCQSGQTAVVFSSVFTYTPN